MQITVSGRALAAATVTGTMLQTAMVLAGHSIPEVARMFGLLGVSLSLLAGFLYGWWSEPLTVPAAMVGGALAGGTCAIIGIAISVALGDVPPAVLGFGTAGSAIAGALGAVAARLLLTGRLSRG